MLKEERMKILEMLKEGAITVDEAESLLKAIDGDAPKVSKNKSLKMLKVLVDSEEGEKVRVQIPIEFTKLLKGNKFNLNLDNTDIDIDELIKMIDSGAVGELVNIDSKGDKVIIKVE